MPIIASAKKQLRQSKKRHERNLHYKKLYTESRVAFEKALKAGDVKAAKALYVNETDKSGKMVRSGLQSNIDKLVKKNIIHANTGSRRKAKFAKMLKTLDQS